MRYTLLSTAARRPWAPGALLGTIMLFAALAIPPAQAGTPDCSDAELPPTSPRDFKCLDEGFRVFTEETFEGNGRTCATCHNGPVATGKSAKGPWSVNRS